MDKETVRQEIQELLGVPEETWRLIATMPDMPEDPGLHNAAVWELGDKGIC
jgi:hypothetical protein